MRYFTTRYANVQWGSRVKIPRSAATVKAGVQCDATTMRRRRDAMRLRTKSECRRVREKQAATGHGKGFETSWAETRNLPARFAHAHGSRAFQVRLFHARIPFYALRWLAVEVELPWRKPVAIGSCRAPSFGRQLGGREAARQRERRAAMEAAVSNRTFKGAGSPA